MNDDGRNRGRDNDLIKENIVRNLTVGRFFPGQLLRGMSFIGLAVAAAVARV